MQLKSDIKIENSQPVPEFSLAFQFLPCLLYAKQLCHLMIPDVDFIIFLAWENQVEAMKNQWMLEMSLKENPNSLPHHLLGKAYHTYSLYAYIFRNISTH